VEPANRARAPESAYELALGKSPRE
jgi:hypothetical protein